MYFLFSERRKNVTIIDPTCVCPVKEAAGYEDSIQLTGTEYGKLATKVADTLAGVPDSGLAEDEDRDSPDAKRIRLVSSSAPTGGMTPVERDGDAAMAAVVGAASDRTVGVAAGRVSIKKNIFLNPPHSSSAGKLEVW